jgi:hypothetical protein
VVLQTLVPQAREIFRLLAQAQLSGEAEEEGAEGALQHVFQPPATAVDFHTACRTYNGTPCVAGRAHAVVDPGAFLRESRCLPAPQVLRSAGLLCRNDIRAAVPHEQRTPACCGRRCLESPSDGVQGPRPAADQVLAIPAALKSAGVHRECVVNNHCAAAHEQMSTAWGITRYVCLCERFEFSAGGDRMVQICSSYPFSPRRSSRC